MAKTSVDIDPARLAQVREILGTETVRATTDAAFQQVIRLRALEGLFELAREGAFAALLEPDVEDGLWGSPAT